MTEHERLVKHIEYKLAFYEASLKISNGRDYFDENKEAEYFFCKPLSLLFDARVTDANREKRNFPGIDLYDRSKRISFQITSTRTKAKVQQTLDEFLDNDLDADFDRLIVLIVTTNKLQSFTNLTFKREFDFDPKRDVWNLSTLVNEFHALPYDERKKLQAFSDYLDTELHPFGTQSRIENNTNSSCLENENDGPFVFISYKCIERPKVIDIVQQLRENGIRIWWDQDIPIGENGIQMLRDQLEQCHCVLSLITDLYFDSRNCRYELQYAYEKEKGPVIVYVDDQRLPDELHKLQEIQAILFSENQTIQDICIQLLTVPSIRACKI